MLFFGGKSENPEVPTVTMEELAQAIWEKMRGHRPGLFDTSAWQGRLMEYAMKDPGFKADLFRFVDALPALKTQAQLQRHIREGLLQDGRTLPLGLQTALKAASGNLGSKIAGAAIRKQVEGMAGRFIVGTDGQTALARLLALHSQGITATVDLLGEACVSEKEADAYAARYAKIIQQVSSTMSQWELPERWQKNRFGATPIANVSIKLSALYSQMSAVSLDKSVACLKKRVLPLLTQARDANVFVNFDLEQHDTRQIAYALFEEVAAEPSLKDWPHLGIVVQAYLVDSAIDLDRVISLANKRGTPLAVRLVKGAYWDYETMLAKQRSWPSPVFMHKPETDSHYEALTHTLLENSDHIYAAFGTHNLRSACVAMHLAKEKGLDQTEYEMQMLHGMAEPQRQALVEHGERLRVYCPVGELLPGMSYLVRRLLENTSNEGFLRLSQDDSRDFEELIRKQETRAPEIETTTSFSTCAFRDFSDATQHRTFAKAVESVAQTFPIEVPVVIDGSNNTGTGPNIRVSPNDGKTAIAEISYATLAQVDAAVAAAYQALPTWRSTPLTDRITTLERLAVLLEKQRDELAAWMVLEVGKPWEEADADVAEAIDFCRYYALRAPAELGPDTSLSLIGEHNEVFYEGHGVTAVIAPWNFPLAILCGMSVGALVAGNSVILKPAEQASAIAYRFFQLLVDSGVPKGVVHFLPGTGELIGSKLVEHPLVSCIAFTGSKKVGLEIQQKAALVAEDQPQLKRVISEMGGKNAIVVDDDADLDVAIRGVVSSAFGFAGQKCSACSRLILLASVYDEFVARLIEATSSLEQSSASNPSCKVGPVVDEVSQQRLLEVIKGTEQEGLLLYRGQTLTEGCFVPPTILEIHDTNHPIMQQELFGPVLAVTKAETFAEALAVANNTKFALTGAVYSRTPSHLQQARETFRVGNLYLNRGSTGALVGRQPFGGFAMSGTGVKAGGPGYLRLFADARCITENTARQGFTPE